MKNGRTRAFEVGGCAAWLRASAGLPPGARGARWTTRPATPSCSTCPWAWWAIGRGTGP
ncbi:hypothetical protein QJS66_13305 [Kocuria rhizophila]|nr:hypothetical protein QJS66_13305 [Kocuria rhizophila]